MIESRKDWKKKARKLGIEYKHQMQLPCIRYVLQSEDTKESFNQ